MRRAILAAAAVLSFVAPTLAQERPAGGPPLVLVVGREEIKPGMMATHDKVAASFQEIARKANAQNYWIGVKPVTGDDNAILYFEAYDSFAAYESARNTFDQAVAASTTLKAQLERVGMQGDVHNNQRTAIYRLRADLSYKPRTMEEVARARYVTVTAVRTKMGRIADYADWVKELNAAREKAGADVHSTVYQSVSGASAGTFLILNAHRSLKEWDEFGARMTEMNKAIEAALGGEEVVKRRRVAYSEAVVDSFSTLFAMEPRLSRPSDEFAAYDAAFWKPAPATTKALASQKEPAKKN